MPSTDWVFPQDSISVDGFYLFSYFITLVKLMATITTISFTKDKNNDILFLCY
jgi:hypothetical protein